MPCAAGMAALGGACFFVTPSPQAHTDCAVACTSGSVSPIAGMPPWDVLSLFGYTGIATEEQMADYRRVFGFTDSDGDGKHSREEYVDNGRYMTPETREGIFSASDNDNDGFVTMDEYVLNRIITDEAKLLYEGMDADGDGALRRAEMLAAIEGDELGAAIWIAFDTDGDGKLDIPEYLRVWGRMARVSDTGGAPVCLASSAHAEIVQSTAAAAGATESVWLGSTEACAGFTFATWADGAPSEPSTCAAMDVASGAWRALPCLSSFRCACAQGEPRLPEPPDSSDGETGGGNAADGDDVDSGATDGKPSRDGNGNNGGGGDDGSSAHSGAVIGGAVAGAVAAVALMGVAYFYFSRGAHCGAPPATNNNGKPRVLDGGQPTV